MVLPTARRSKFRIPAGEKKKTSEEFLPCSLLLQQKTTKKALSQTSWKQQYESFGAMQTIIYQIHLKLKLTIKENINRTFIPVFIIFF